ncbi:MAG: 23S rRNA (guanosine(2251)-2'-O)-methyltransferase RlmB, partial [Microcoleus sp. SU_5_3]|nr:23S rRNA (guanosine(2251)-2'-O)-methyltransferase RlmB [Microcoleus sp. SU_5_3]
MRKFPKPNPQRQHPDSKPFKSEDRPQESKPFSRLERKPRPDTRSTTGPQKRSPYAPPSQEMPVRSVFKRNVETDGQPELRKGNYYKDRDSSPQEFRGDRYKDRDSSPQEFRGDRYRDRDSSPQE